MAYDFVSTSLMLFMGRELILSVTVPLITNIVVAMPISLFVLQLIKIPEMTIKANTLLRFCRILFFMFLSCWLLGLRRCSNLSYKVRIVVVIYATKIIIILD